jgi:hypothetical protein
VGVNLTLPRSGRVLVVAQGGQASAGGAADGDCRIEADESSIGGDQGQAPGESEDNTNPDANNGFALTAVSGILPAGLHRFEMSCDQDSGDQFINNMQISALAIAGG